MGIVNDRAAEIVRKYISSKGIPLSYISKHTTIRYELLRRSILAKSRKLSADEFLAILACLGIDVKLTKEQEIIPLL